MAGELVNPGESIPATLIKFCGNSLIIKSAVLDLAL
jgi:hypothetical protein